MPVSKKTVPPLEPSLGEAGKPTTFVALENRRFPFSLACQEPAELMTEYEDTLCNPYLAAERGYIDAVIEPAETRAEVVKALRLLRTKRETLPPKKHGNIPL